MNNFFYKRKGFTLIELMVVIAIIGILASIVIVSLNSSKGNARDTQRKQDLENIQGALEVYYSTNANYPVGTFDSRQSSQWATFTSDLSSLFTPPIDPLNGAGSGAMCSNCGEYYYVGTAQHYLISTYLESASESFVTGTNQYGPYYSVHSSCTQTDFWDCN